MNGRPISTEVIEDCFKFRYSEQKINYTLQETLHPIPLNILEKCKDGKSNDCDLCNRRNRLGFVIEEGCLIKHVNLRESRNNTHVSNQRPPKVATFMLKIRL